MLDHARAVAVLALSLVWAVLGTACGGGGGDGGDFRVPPPPQENPGFRAIAGVSMGAYGAFNLGTKRSDIFGVIGSLGGPVDMGQLIHDVEAGALSVSPITSSPTAPGERTTFDHLPLYPGRDTTFTMLKDLVLAFGNPFLHHPDPARQFLAVDSEPAAIRQDDRYGAFVVPADPRGFLDGGDGNDDGQRQGDESPVLPMDVVLLAGGSLPRIAPEAQGFDVGGRQVADLNGDGIVDVGDGVVVNSSEPFDDADGNGVHDPGESFQDAGLDGVAGTGDFGEGNGTFDVDPDRARWLAEDPLTRIEGRSAADLESQRIYMDVGTEDEFRFALHYDHVVEALRTKGIGVEVQDGFSGNCAEVPSPSAQVLLVRYPGGHVGFAEDEFQDDLLDGDVCGQLTVWQRLVTLLGFLDESFPDGNYGTGIDFDFDPRNLDDFFDDVEVRGDVVEADVPSPSLATSPDAVPTRHVLVYRPIEFFNGDDSFPIVYFMPGYGQTPDDYRRMRDLLDVLILTRQIQNMFVAVLPGDGGHIGSFYVNHAVPESQAPGATAVTSGLYEDSFVADIIPYVESEIAHGRIRR